MPSHLQLITLHLVKSLGDFFFFPSKENFDSNTNNDLVSNLKKDQKKKKWG